MATGSNWEVGVEERGTRALAPISGDGLLARVGDLVLLCAVAGGSGGVGETSDPDGDGAGRPNDGGDPNDGEDPNDGGGTDDTGGPRGSGGGPFEAHTAELLDTVESVAAGGGDGRRLGRRLASLIASSGLDDDGFPALAACGPVAGGLAVLVHGAAQVRVTTDSEEVRLDGRDAVTWVDRMVVGEVRSVRAAVGALVDGPAGTSGPDRWVHLDAGVVRAGGFVLGPAGVDTADAPVPTADSSASTADESLPTADTRAPSDAPAPTTDASVSTAETFDSAGDGSARVAEAAAPDDAPAPTTDASAPEHVPDVGAEPPSSSAGAPLVGDRPRAHADDHLSPADVSADPTGPAAADSPVRAAVAVQSPPPARHAAPSVVAPTALTPVVDLDAVESAATAGSDTAPDGAAGAARRDAPFTSVVLVGGAPPELGDLTRPPLPPGDGRRRDPSGSPEPADPPVVAGVSCKNGHFTDPSAPYCAVCGVMMEPGQDAPESGPRPPLGVLVLDDGATFRLDAGYVVGREPDRDPEVLAGRARPLRIADPDGVVSRIHARVDLEGWAVTVVDLGSANGTHLRPAGGETWTRIPPRTPVSITPGTRVVFGRHGFRYETPRTA